jgi:hypothetical protein
MIPKPGNYRPIFFRSIDGNQSLTKYRKVNSAEYDKVYTITKLDLLKGCKIYHMELINVDKTH